MLHRRCRFQDLYGWIVLIIIIIYYVPAKLCNQRKMFSYDVEMNNKGIFSFTFYIVIICSFYCIPSIPCPFVSLFVLIIGVHNS